MVKLADVLPLAMNTVAGTVAEELLVDSVTTMPPAGAADPSVTVPVEDFPPSRVLGFKVSELIEGGLIVRLADADPELVLPLMAAIV